MRYVNVANSSLIHAMIFDGATLVVFVTMYYCYYYSTGALRREHPKQSQYLCPLFRVSPKIRKLRREIAGYKVQIGISRYMVAIKWKERWYST